MRSVNDTGSIPRLIGARAVTFDVHKVQVVTSIINVHNNAIKSGKRAGVRQLDTVLRGYGHRWDSYIHSDGTIDLDVEHLHEKSLDELYSIILKTRISASDYR